MGLVPLACESFLAWSGKTHDKNGDYLMIIYLIITPNSNVVKSSGNNVPVLVGHKFSFHMAKLAASHNGWTQAATCSPVVSKHMVKTR